VSQETKTGYNSWQGQDTLQCKTVLPRMFVATTASCHFESAPGSTAARGALGAEVGGCLEAAATMTGSAAAPASLPSLCFFFFWPPLPGPLGCDPAKAGCEGVSIGAGSGAACGGSCSAATDACRCISEPGTRPACSQMQFRPSHNKPISPVVHLPA